VDQLLVGVERPLLAPGGRHLAPRQVGPRRVWWQFGVSGLLGLLHRQVFLLVRQLAERPRRFVIHPGAGRFGGQWLLQFIGPPHPRLGRLERRVPPLLIHLLGRVLLVRVVARLVPQ